MRVRAPTPRHERAATLAAAVTLHAALLLLMLSLSAARPVPPAMTGGHLLVSLNLDKDRGKPPPPALPSKAADRSRPVAAPAISSDLESRALGASGCAPLEVVGRALVADPAAVGAVLRVPPEHRSIAEAVVIWNAGWSETAKDLAAPLGPVRAVLEQHLAALPAECLEQHVAGPRLIPIPAGDGRTMFLVIGSGQWTWAQLLRESTAPAEVPDGQGLADEIRDWLSMFDGS